MVCIAPFSADEVGGAGPPCLCECSIGFRMVVCCLCIDLIDLNVNATHATTSATARLPVLPVQIHTLYMTPYETRSMRELAALSAGERGGAVGKTLRVDPPIYDIPKSEAISVHDGTIDIHSAKKLIQNLRSKHVQKMHLVSPRIPFGDKDK